MRAKCNLRSIRDHVRACPLLPAPPESRDPTEADLRAIAEVFSWVKRKQRDEPATYLHLAQAAWDLGARPKAASPRCACLCVCATEPKQ